MKIFKTIFRLDFPVAYGILDKLGAYLEFLTSKTRQKPFEAIRTDIDLSQHSITCTAKVVNDFFNISLDLSTLSGFIEFQNGKNINGIAREPIFTLAEELIQKLEMQTNSKYDRIGLRSYIILQKEQLHFESIRDYFWQCNNLIGEILTGFYEVKNDIALAFEAKSPTEFIRLNLGPYQSSEKNRYFSLKNDIKEGLLIDIDIWESNISIPDFKLVEMIRNHEKKYLDLIKNIESQILRVVS